MNIVTRFEAGDDLDEQIREEIGHDVYMVTAIDGPYLDGRDKYGPVYKYRVEFIEGEELE